MSDCKCVKLMCEDWGGFGYTYTGRDTPKGSGLYARVDCPDCGGTGEVIRLTAGDPSKTTLDLSAQPTAVIYQGQRYTAGPDGSIRVPAHSYMTVDELRCVLDDAPSYVVPDGEGSVTFGVNPDTFRPTLEGFEALDRAIAKAVVGEALTAEMLGPDLSPLQALASAVVLPALCEAWRAKNPHARVTVDPSRDWAVVRLELGPWAGTVRLWWKPENVSLSDRAVTLLEMAWLEASDAVAKAWRPAR